MKYAIHFALFISIYTCLLTCSISTSIQTFISLAGSVTDQGDGSYDAFVAAKVAGSGLLCASQLAAGGLHATMYTDTEFQQVVGVQSFTTFDYSRAASPFLFPLADPQDDALFSIRFAGYYKPTVSLKFSILTLFVLI